jgi:steroid delta-isomerase-like uncharacterized protein
MDNQSLKDLARRWVFSVWDEGNFDLIGEMTAEGWTFQVNQIEPYGVDTYPAAISMYRAAFPDMKNTIEEQVVEGNVVVTRGTTRGTHQGPLGGIPATGKKVAVPWVIFTRFDGGRLIEGWEIFDEHGFLKQLGVVPESD